MTDEIKNDNSETVDHLKPIKDAVGSVGIDMPKLVAEGDLTVEAKEDKKVETKKELTKKDIPLPEIGTKFMVGGHEYKVIYINPGQHRFSCEPCKGLY
jgi:hypothetical protein